MGDADEGCDGKKIFGVEQQSVSMVCEAKQTPHIDKNVSIHLVFYI